mgnify:CR=1 FL=1
MSRQSLAELQRRILHRKGVVLEKHTRHPISLDIHPDTYHKTPKMKYIELKYHIRLENILPFYSLNELRQKFGGEVDTGTLSRWRKYINYIGGNDANY